MIFLLAALIISYFLGSIPTAYLFGKILKGIDIRQVGSGNVGATNAFRVLGKGPGTCVLLIDIAKGAVALTLVGDHFHLEGFFSRAALGIAAVVGHNWTCFLQFKGGKGIATTLGVLIGLAIHFPHFQSVLLACVSVWLICFLASGYVSLASMVAAVILPIAMLITNQGFPMVLLGVIFCIFVILRHRPNIRRLISGQESRVPLFFHKKPRR